MSATRKKTQKLSVYKHRLFSNSVSTNQFVLAKYLLQDLIEPISIEDTLEVIKNLSDKTQLEAHDLIYLINAYQQISQMSESRYQLFLRNAVIAQLTRYAADFMLTTNFVSLVAAMLLYGPSSLSSVTDNSIFILKILLINTSQKILQEMLENKLEISGSDIASAFIFNGPKRLLNELISAPSTTKELATHIYTFAESNLNFFYHKYIGTAPIEYELPEDLAKIRRQMQW